MDGRSTLPVNAMLDGGYRIVRVVGAGGFGITYEAKDVSLGIPVAIKEYYPVDFGDRDATMCVRARSEDHKRTFEWGRSNFLQEARTLARFEHPGIVRVLRVFEANSTAYMVMRFEEGQSFEAWLASLGRSPTQEELDAIVAPVLDVLDLIHAEKILHRDIAPDNIIVRTDGTPVLLDFGAARRAPAEGSRALTGVIKAGYSPHEQYASSSRLQGPWSDLYALGGTLYRAVAGRPPEEAALRVDNDCMPSAMKAASAGYRPGFLAAIDACLKVRQADRPQSVTQLRAMLLGRSLLPVLGKWRAIAPSARPAARHWAPGIAMALALLSGGYGGLAYTRWQGIEQRTPETGANLRMGTATVDQSDRDTPADRREQAEAERKREELLAGEKKAAEERARKEAEAKRQAPQKGAFDGDWEVVGHGGELCRHKQWKYRISIQNDRILVPTLPPGKVNSAGDFTYRYGAWGWRNLPPGTFSGTLKGDSGSGQYNYSDLCLGSMKLRRL